MNIGIDIDGVLTDIEQWQLDYGSKVVFEKYHTGIVNPEGYDIKEIFDVDKNLDDEFWRKYLFDYAKNEPARKFANEVTKKLSNDGNKVYIITARFLTDRDTAEGQEMREILRNWLKENEIYYDEIIFSPEDKLEICLNNNIDVMIDDKVENINKISKHIPVICFNAGYNKECKGKNIYRAYSWYDIYSKIKEIENKNKIVIFDWGGVIESHKEGEYSIDKAIINLIKHFNSKEEENPNIKYRKRPGAYAIMTRNEDDKVGIVTDGRDLFYLGGGIEEGETKLQALKREFIEETGYTIKNIKPFDEVRSFIDGEEKGHLEVEAYVYTAEFDEKVAEPIEKDHKVLWVNPEEYKDKLYREWQKYILKEYVERMQ